MFAYARFNNRLSDNTMSNPPEEKLYSRTDLWSTGLNGNDRKSLRAWEMPVKKNGWTEYVYPESAVKRQLAVREELDHFKKRDKKYYKERMVEERSLRKAEKRNKATDEAKAIVGKFNTGDSLINDVTLKLSSINLPQEIVCMVIKRVVDSYEPEGVRGVAITLKDLANIGLSCPDLFLAVKYGLHYFASILPRIPGLEGVDLDTLVRDPTNKSIKGDHLRIMLRYFGLRLNGNKICKSG